MRNIGPARLALLAAAMAVAALLGSPAPALGASFTVNATHDAVDASPGDGVCADAGGACTLRAAVMEANALPGADEISLPAGFYRINIEGADEDAAASGDLDILEDVRIRGPGHDAAIIAAASGTNRLHDRVLDVLRGYATISGMNLVQGVTDGLGGGIRIRT